MAKYKTCSTKESRKKHDNGSGRLWTLRYSNNNSCGDVNADDCPVVINPPETIKGLDGGTKT